MNVSIIIPAQASDARRLASCLEGILAQDYHAGQIEVLVVQYGGGDPLVVPSSFPAPQFQLWALNGLSQYAARNLAAIRATGDAFLFTEPNCIPERGWVGAHVARLRDPTVTVSVGHVAPAKMTRLLNMFLSYEAVRDAWVFSSPHFQHYFGRPKNMAIVQRRFGTHGPFADVIRGADSSFVQKVAREVSCSEIALTHRAIVRLQSIRSLSTCFRDRFSHACAMQIHHSAHAAPIELEERMRLVRNTIELHSYGLVNAALLRALLSAGLLVFRLGSWVGRLRAMNFE